jgi:nucleotidyltransferase substrate binding protein (TIGR01987 family)
MERLINHLKKLKQALKTLDESLSKFSQRFEYSIDLFWKTLKDYLEITKGLTTVASPKPLFRIAFDAEIISEEEYTLCLNMIEDRNLTSHAYNAEIAEEIAAHLHNYSKIMHTIVYRIEHESKVIL